MNKKGQFGLVGLGVGVVLAIVLILAFIFSNTFRWIIVGAVLFGIGAMVLFKGNFKSDRTRIFTTIGFIAVALFFVIGAGNILQSTLSVDKVSVGSDGKVYWLVTAIADSIDEGYEFNYNPTDFTKNDGSIVKPQDSLTLRISKKQGYCKYTLQDETYKQGTYKVLSNADRVAEIYIQDSKKGDIRVMDGTITDSQELSDGLIIKTQGIISGKNDCPPQENVAILDDGRIVNKDELKIEIDNYCPWYNPLCLGNNLLRLTTGNIPEVKDNQQFISAFESSPVVTENEVRGNLNIGSGIFTITANQDYFNSVIILPPKEVDPEIESIKIASEVKEGSTTSIKTTISNKEDSEGIIRVTATSNDLSISSDSRNVNIKDEVTLNFVATSSNNEGSSQVCIEASSTGQFGSPNTDKECKSFRITKEQPKEFCGDGICQDSESSTSCVKDCEDDDDDSDELECNIFQNKVLKTEKTCGLGCFSAKVLTFGKFDLTQEAEFEDCVTKDIVWISVIFIIVGALGFYAISVTSGRKKRK